MGKWLLSEIRCVHPDRFFICVRQLLKISGKRRGSYGLLLICFIVKCRKLLQLTSQRQSILLSTRIFLITEVKMLLTTVFYHNIDIK